MSLLEILFSKKDVVKLTTIELHVFAYKPSRVYTDPTTITCADTKTNLSSRNKDDCNNICSTCMPCIFWIFIIEGYLNCKMNIMQIMDAIVNYQVNNWEKKLGEYLNGMPPLIAKRIISMLKEGIEVDAKLPEQVSHVVTHIIKHIKQMTHLHNVLYELFVRMNAVIYSSKCGFFDMSDRYWNEINDLFKTYSFSDVQKIEAFKYLATILPNFTIELIDDFLLCTTSFELATRHRFIVDTTSVKLDGRRHFIVGEYNSLETNTCVHEIPLPPGFIQHQYNHHDFVLTESRLQNQIKDEFEIASMYADIAVKLVKASKTNMFVVQHLFWICIQTNTYKLFEKLFNKRVFN